MEPIARAYAAYEGARNAANPFGGRELHWHELSADTQAAWTTALAHAPLAAIVEHPAFRAVENLTHDVPHTRNLVRLTMAAPDGTVWTAQGALPEVLAQAYGELPLDG